jgi:hypothetical protein
MKIINTYDQYPDLDRLGASLLVVLTEGAVNDLACYAGIVRLDRDAPNYRAEREAAALKVARDGDKMSYRRARGYFPNLPEESYRA